MKVLAILLVYWFEFLFAPFNTSAPSDSTRAVKIFSKSFPQESRRDYKRFMKIYSDPEVFEKLVKGKDST